MPRGPSLQGRRRLHTWFERSPTAWPEDWGRCARRHTSAEIPSCPHGRTPPQPGPWPETGAADLVRVRLTRDGIRIGPFRRASPGKSRDRQIEASPEKMDWAALPDIPRPKLLHDRVGGDQHAPEAVRVFGIV